MPPPNSVIDLDPHNLNAEALGVEETVEVTASLETLTTKTDQDQLKVATLVFFDVETTGLAACVGKKNVQITEISMIAIDRNEFSVCHFPDLRDVRIVHKMSLCIRPMCSVSSVAANLTGLNNGNLQNQEPFDNNTATAILAFFSHLPKPVCLLAHNGKLFDFPLLKSEFLKLNLMLPSDIYIVDSLSAIRSIGIPDLPLNQTLHKNVKFKKNGDISYSLQNLHLYFFGKLHLGNHSSEGDCIALAKVCHKIREKILPFLDSNLLNFDSIKPMW